MGKILDMSRISIKAIRGKNVVFHIFFSCIIIFTILPMLLQGVSQSLIGEISIAEKDVYGEFTDILYLDNIDKDFNIDRNFTMNELKGFKYNKIGVIYLCNNDDINMGYADKTALKLGHIKLYQGDFPTNQNEVAITKSLQKKMNLSPQLNQLIEIKGHAYKLVGIVEDYGRLWPKREQQTKSSSTSLDVFLGKEDIRKLNYSNSVSAQILLYGHKSDEISSSSKILPNLNNHFGESGGGFRIPKVFFFVLFVCEFLILYNIMLLSHEKLKKRCKIYSLLGMINKDIFKSVIIEFVLLLLIGSFAGTLIGIVMLYILIHFISVFLNANLHVIGLTNMMFIIVFFLIFAFFCIFFYVSKTVQKSNEKAVVNIRRSKKIYIKHTFVRLIFDEFKHQQHVCVFWILLLGMCSTFLEYGIVYKNYFSFISTYKEYEGKLPYDYDFEFSTILRNLDKINKNEKSVYVDSTYEKDGATDEIASTIKNTKGIKQVLRYKENNKVNILLPPELMDLYLDASDYLVDGKYKPLGGYHGLEDFMKYNKEMLIKTKINGYNDNEVLGFKKYVVEGKIDLEKLNSGEEVILVAPPFTLTQMNDGGIKKEWCRVDAEECYQNTLFHAGSTITLTWLESLKGYNGGIDEETLLSDYQRKDKKVVIGAILGAYVGWFENEVTMGESYYLFTTNRAFENLGMNVTYNRMRIYTENGYSYKEISEIMKNISTELPFMHLQDLKTELENYRRLKLLIEFFCAILLFLVEMLLLLCLTSQILFKTKLNIKKYMLLRINGLSEKKLIYLIGIQVLLLSLLGMAISYPILFLFAYQSFDFGFLTTLAYLSDLETIGFMLSFCPVIIVSLIPSAIFIHKAKIRKC